MIGERSEETISFLKACDIERVLTVDHELVKSYNADGYASIVSQVIDNSISKPYYCRAYISD